MTARAVLVLTITLALSLGSASVLFAFDPPAPSCAILPGSTMDGKAREFDTENLYDYMDGNSEGYFLYGFAKMRGITCVKGDVKMIVDLSEFKSDELAYGMFSANYDSRQPTEKMGANGQVTPRKITFVKGPYYAELAVEADNQTAILRSSALALEKTLPGSTAAPSALAWFPKDKIQPGFPRLVPQSVLGMRMLQRGYLAQYDTGKAVVVTEESPATATALFAKLKERFAPAAAAKGGDEAFTAEDRYLGRLCFMRKGARIIGWTNTPASADPAALAATLAASVP